MRLSGKPIEIRYSNHLRDTSGNPAHAATYIRKRLIVLDEELRGKPREHERILLHELFHFVWVKLGNQRRAAWSDYLASERRSGARGETGWSAEWRKRRLTDTDVRNRTLAWRDYCCESFCDTGACLHAKGAHREVTLAQRRLAKRRALFESLFAREQLADSFPI